MERLAKRRGAVTVTSDESARPTVRRSPLRVGAANDPAEREADRIAARVMAVLTDHSPVDDPVARSSSRIRRSSAPPVVGAEGGELTDDVATRVRAARSSGRPLDPSIRRPMEQAFGTGFSRIRLHDGPEAAGLNDAFGARAFTLGHDIFVRQPIDARHPGDQHLLAHELAHTVQQGGSDRGPAARVIRRDIGFEFEVGSWTVEYIEQATEDQTAGVAPFTDADIENRRLTKDTVIHAGRGFNLKPDEADDGSWHMEFVVEPPVPETKSGRSRLERTMKDLRSFNDRLIKKGKSAFLTRANDAAPRLRTGDLGCTEPWVLLTPRRNIEGEPQLTAGIRLDQLGRLMSQLAPGALPGESAAETAARRTGASYLGGKGDSALVGQSPSQVRSLYSTFPGRAPRSPETPSDALVSYLALVRTYLTKAAAPMAYAKSLAPIMARTDFGAMFAVLPERLYYRTYPEEFVGLALHVAGMSGQGAQPFFTGRSTYSDPKKWARVQAALTREQWLRDLTREIDRVTVAHFPDRKVAGFLFGFGSKGKKTDTVGKRGSETETEAPIFELRRMIGHVDYRVWATMALELFDFIAALNRQKSATFTARKTDAKVANL